MLKKTINRDNVNNIVEIVNKNNGKYVEFWRKNPDKMVMYVNGDTLSDNQLKKFNDKAWDVVIGCFKNLCEMSDVKEAIQSLVEYSGFWGYDLYNGILRFESQSQRILDKIDEDTSTEVLKSEVDALKQITKGLTFGNDIEERAENFKLIQEKMNNLDKCIEKHKNINNFKKELIEVQNTINKLSEKYGYPEKIKVLEKLFVNAAPDTKYLKLNRMSGVNDFEQLELDGQKLSELMAKAGKDSTLRDKILDYLNEETPELLDSGFTSTSISPYKVLFGNVEWHLSMAEGVKYTYVSDIAHMFGNDVGETEAEILIFPKQKRRIVSADYQNGKWIIKAEVMPQ